MPLKAGDYRECFKDNQKYGGYNKVSGAFFSLVEYTEKGERIRSIVDIPICRKNFLVEHEKMEKYFEQERGLSDPELIVSCIKVYSVLKINGFRYYIAARSNDQLVFAPAEQLVLSNENEKYIKKVLKFVNRANDYAKRDRNRAPLQAGKFDGVTFDENLRIYNILLRKIEDSIFNISLGKYSKKLEAGRELFIKLPVLDQCKVLEQMLNLFACNRVNADLTMIGLVKNTGVMTANRNVGKADSFTIIYQSITGLFEQEVDLQK